ncbi:glycosyltransferase [Candidatus Accumulibacter sp. ACC003]|uniref:glycosyltransferase n=1 Tax=Candidatus Accumulibacter sp. ACC003 TaxID=2823334 RepID=UPI0025C1F733|nr:glycosyltransferase [Candidatus Accumulibacter sp. ACC003]
MLDGLQTARAWALYEAGDYEKSLRAYEALKFATNSSAYDYNISMIRALVEFGGADDDPYDWGRVVKSGLGVDNIYVCNLKRRKDRRLRISRELNRSGLHFEIVDGVDAKFDRTANKLYEDFKTRPLADGLRSTAHLSVEQRRSHKRSITLGAMGYLLSQKKIFEDANSKRYKRILILDDDVFFVSNVGNRLKNALAKMPPWKMLLLGSSEYSNRTSSEFGDNARCIEANGFYKPVPGKTCGSFAVVYDESIYQCIIDLISEYDGTYDNCVLGAVYSLYPNECFVIDPSIVIPDVSESNIRDAGRDIVSHGKRMAWDISNYERFARPLTVSIILSDFSKLASLRSLDPRPAIDICIRVFYLTNDGLRPIIPGHTFIPADDRPVVSIIESEEEFLAAIERYRIPFSDFIFNWPSYRSITEESIRDVCIVGVESVDARLKFGVIDGVSFMREAGVKARPGMHSIIIPSFRRAEEVWPSVKSALNQDFEDLEVILVNDNPLNVDFEEKMREFVSDFSKADSHGDAHASVVIINHSVNRNASAARNTGFYRSSGEYVSFLDDDDLYDANRISVINKALAGSLDGVGACYCGYQGKWNGERDESRFRNGDLTDSVIALDYSSHYMCTNTVTYKRACFSGLGGFNESYLRHQDIELVLRFFERYEMSSVNSYCVHNRPVAVSETFKADVYKLMKLKVSFFYDFSYLLKNKGRDYIERVLSAHATDVLKRCRDGKDHHQDLVIGAFRELIRVNN